MHLAETPDALDGKEHARKHLHMIQSEAAVAMLELAGVIWYEGPPPFSPNSMQALAFSLLIIELAKETCLVSRASSFNIRSSNVLILPCGP
jgi:hypothetical protein